MRHKEFLDENLRTWTSQNRFAVHGSSKNWIKTFPLNLYNFWASHSKYGARWELQTRSRTQSQSGRHQNSNIISYCLFLPMSSCLVNCRTSMSEHKEIECLRTVEMRADASDQISRISLLFFRFSMSFPLAHHSKILSNLSTCFWLSAAWSAISANSKSARDLNGVHGASELVLGGGMSAGLGPRNCSNVLDFSFQPLFGWYSV